MRFQLLLPALLCVTLAACQTSAPSTSATETRPSAQPAAPQTAAGNPSNRELALKICSADAQKCNCLADQMLQTLTAKEWSILNAAYNKDPNPPAGTADSDLQQLANKLNSADSVCSR